MSVNPGPMMKIEFIATKTIEISSKDGLTVDEPWTEVYWNNEVREVLKITSTDVTARVYMPAKVFDPGDLEDADWTVADKAPESVDYILFDIKAGQSFTFVPHPVEFQLKYFVTRLIVDNVVNELERAPVIIIHKQVSLSI